MLSLRGLVKIDNPPAIPREGGAVNVTTTKRERSASPFNMSNLITRRRIRFK